MRFKVTETETVLDLPEDWDCEIRKEHRGWKCILAAPRSDAIGYERPYTVTTVEKCRTEAVMTAIRKANIIIDALKDFQP